MATKIATVAKGDANQIKDKTDQPHSDHEMNDDRVDRVHPGQVVIVERRQQLDHRS
jgi:hypothetical protein